MSAYISVLPPSKALKTLNTDVMHGVDYSNVRLHMHMQVLPTREKSYDLTTDESPPPFHPTSKMRLSRSDQSQPALCSLA